MSHDLELTPEEVSQIEKNQGATGPDERNKAFYVTDDGVTVHGKFIRKIDATTFSMMLDLGNLYFSGGIADGQRPRNYDMLEFLWVHTAPKEEVARALITSNREAVAVLVGDFISKAFSIDQLPDAIAAAAAMMNSLNLAGNFTVKDQGGGDPKGSAPVGSPATS